MRKLFLIVTAFLILVIALPAQVTVFGTVYFGTTDGATVPGWAVEVWSPGDDQILVTETDDEGNYEIAFDMTGTSGDVMSVRTFDICTGVMLSEDLVIDPAQLMYEIDFVLCEGIDPPPPPECEAYFYWEQIPTDEGFLVQFFDVSHTGADPAITWEWDFGDGTGSNEENPVHTYAEAGEYVVVLTIASEDCLSTISQIIIVYDEGDCDCPTDEYIPVCVNTASGQTIEFTNACYAECAGYTADQYYLCDGNECGCPEFYAPVCVVTADGEIIEFQNHCFAECEGYGPDQWTECEQECECPEDVYDPVCVYNPFGEVIQFDNACFAECAGYLPGQYQPCDGGCECPEFYDPVCVILDDGTVLTFDNFCFAQCEGYGPEQWEECENDCECPEDLYDPVCVATPGGIILTFINPCEAECAGYGPDVYYHCDDECVCPEYLDPVCVIGPDGDVITFDNPCFAECAGYGPDQYFPCDGGCSVGIDYTFVDSYTYQFQAILNADPAVTYLWDFGDGMTSTEANPTHTYPEEQGVYLVQLTVTTADGCVATAKTWVFAGPECYAIIIALPLEENPLSIAFGAIATGDVVVWEWTFGDGISSTEAAPVHTYDEAGVYVVTLTTVTEDGCTFTVVQEIVVGEDPCVCTDEWDPVCVLTASGEIITFGNACEAACFGYEEGDFVPCDPDCVCPDVYDPVCVLDPATGDIYTFGNACEAECAGFGPDQFVPCDGECECPAIWDPVCVSGIAGIITFPNACVAECEGFGPEDFIDCNPDCGCTDEWDPVCVATASGEIVTFPNVCIAECEGFTPDDFVNCPDCICDDYYLPVCVIDPASGAFLMFNNPCEAACAGYGADDIFPCGPGEDCYADFSFVTYDDTEVGHRVSFFDESFAVDGITSWFWDFGDGNTSTEQNPEHVYEEDGVYDVTLTIESPDCGAITTTYHICLGEGGGVGGPSCQAFFFFEQPDPDDLFTFQFIDFSLGSGSAWFWDFGDGATSSEQNPVHTYAEEGFYVVSLTIFNDECESTVQIGVQAGENVWYGDLECRAWFLPIINPATLEVYFINLSSADAIEFLWDFGDGTTSMDPLALHTYSEPGTYTVTLTTTNAEGCTNTFSATVTLDGEEDGFTSNPVFSLVSSTQEVLTAMPLLAAPNPVTDVTRIRWESEEPLNGTWSLLDMNGRLLQQQNLRVPAGVQQLDVDMQQLPAGIYLFRLQTDEGQQFVRLSKL